MKCEEGKINMQSKQREHARKDWDTYFMDIAYMVSTRSRCHRRHVGAVLVQGKKLLGTAYNGAPMGVEDCEEAGCMITEEFELVHNEQNLLLFTDRIDREASVVYVTYKACLNYTNMLVNSGVKEILLHRPNEKYGQTLRHLTEQVVIIFGSLDLYGPPAHAPRDIQ